MREINCNIIRDLLPSYVDQICSEDSRMLVEEHLNECEQCRAQSELLKNTELTDRQGEQGRIFYLKKVKRYYVSFIILTLFVTGDAWFMIQHFEIIGSSLFYVVLPLMLTAAYCLLPDSPLSAKHTKISGLLMMINILLMIYFSVLAYWGIQISRTGRGLFGIPLAGTGPFMNRQLIFIIVVQIGIFVLSNIMIFCAYHINKCIYGLSLTGMYLAAGYICLLHNMSSVEIFYHQLLQMIVYIALEGAVFSVVAYVLAKKVICLLIHPGKQYN